MKKSLHFGKLRQVLLLGFLMTVGSSWGQEILTFEFSALGGAETTSISNFNNPGLTNSTISRGAGLTASANASRYNATSWALESIANAVSGNDYMEFTVTPNVDKKFSVTTIVVNWQRSGTGNTAIALRSSVDSYANNIDGIKNVTDGTATQVFTWTVNQADNATPVTYRFYSYAESATGTGGPGDGAGNDIVVNGTVEDNITNVSPTASNVQISGLPNTGVELSGTYDYEDADDDLEGASELRWYSADDASGTNSVLVATAATYTLDNDDLENYIRLGVTPVNAGTSPGTEAFSAWIGPVVAAGTPIVSAGSLAAFADTCIATNSAAQSVTVTGANLDAVDVQVGPLAGFAFSATENGTYTSTLTITPVDGAVNSPVWVRFSPVSAMVYDGNIPVSGGGATTVNIAAEGTGINTAVVVTTGSASGITATGATVAATLVAGCSAITAYGIEYSTTINFDNGTGTQAAGSNLDAGAYSVAVSGLSPNTTYYFKGYATDGTGTVYGSQGSFTTSQLGAPTATAATAVSATGFTANWNAVAGATGYALDVYTGGESINPDVEILYNAATGSNTNASPPTGWVYNITDGTAYLRIITSSHMVVTPIMDFSILTNGELTFDARTFGGVSAANNIVTVSISTDPVSDVWVQLATRTPLNTTLTAVSPISLAGITSTRVKLKFEELGASGTIGVGIAEITVTADQSVSTIDYVAGYEDLTVAGTSQIVTGLTPETEYSYRVRATSTNSTSANSNAIDVTTLDDTTTWNGSVWSNGTPTAALDAVIAGNYNTATNGGFTARTLAVNSATFTIAADGTDPVSDNSVTVVNAITSAGATNFIVENNAVLLQTNDAANTGNITVRRNSSLLYRQDYTLWSAPVEGQNLRAFSPQTLFNRFSGYDPSNDVYVQLLFTTEDVNTIEFEPGQGYQIRMPNNWTEFVDAGTPGTVYEGSFVGVPNNGNVAAAVDAGYNLIGNPYPSPISISAFFEANDGLTTETLYFWRKRNGVAGSGYATYTEAMGLTSTQPGIGGLEIDDTIAVGQGFFVQSPTGTDLVFNNDMRVDHSDAMFFRSPPAERHRLWLNLSNTANVVSQTLLGYVSGATQGVDSGIDGLYFNDSAVALTSLIGTTPYAIQGRSLPFAATDVVPLQFKTNTAGSYTISLAQFDGLFDGDQDIYLQDLLTNTEHDLKAASYTFASEAGVFDSRFQVVYQQSTLGINNPDAMTSIVVYTQDRQLMVNAGVQNMVTVALYDISGRLVFTQTGIHATQVALTAVPKQQVLMMKITMDNGNSVWKKIIF